MMADKAKHWLTETHNASPVPAENPQIGSGQSERNGCSSSQTMVGECSEGQAATVLCFAEPVQVANMA
ncbi:MAG: hypothetical protein ACOCNL_10615 [Acetivibrio ethanolgignens]